MHSIINRRRPAIVLLIAGSLLVTTFAGPPASFAGRGENRILLKHFMTGLACIESGGRYTAVNPTSGAYGKYQIMPRNWPAWTARYIRDRWAQPTPPNQEFIARQRIIDLYVKRENWRRVAYWWLTGDGEADESRWSAKSLNYVNRVMAVAARAASPRLAAVVPGRCSPRPFAEPSVRTEPRARVRVTGGRVFMRRAAGYENRAMAVVRRGQRLTVLGKGFDSRGKRWLKVGLVDNGIGRIGWVASWLTELMPE